MQFILEQQAKFEANIQLLQEAQRETSLQIQQSTAHIEQNAAQIQQHAAQIQENSQHIRTLITVAGAHGLRMDSFEGEVRALIEVTHQRTDSFEGEVRALIEAGHERMNAFEHNFREFLARFDAYLRGQGGNGSEG
jgi:chromosome segregation ATPase